MKTTDTTRIADIYSRPDAMAEANRRYAAGNNSGEGFAPEDEGLDLDAAERVLTAQNDREVDVYALADGREIAVGDSYGEWAVEITAARSEAV